MNTTKGFQNLTELLFSFAGNAFVCGVIISMALILGGGLVYLAVLPFVLMSPALLTTFEKFSSNTELLFTMTMYLCQGIVICSLIAGGITTYGLWKEDQNEQNDPEFVGRRRTPWFRWLITCY